MWLSVSAVVSAFASYRFSGWYLWWNGKRNVYIQLRHQGYKRTTGQPEAQSQYFIHLVNEQLKTVFFTLVNKISQWIFVFYIDKDLFTSVEKKHTQKYIGMQHWPSQRRKVRFLFQYIAIFQFPPENNGTRLSIRKKLLNYLY